MKKLILLDIDNTLFDSPSYKAELFTYIAPLLENKGIVGAQDLCENVYMLSRKASGLFSPDLFVKTLEEQMHLDVEAKEEIMKIIFDGNLLQKHIFSEVKGTLDTLKTFGDLGVFSQGEEKIQKAKIRELLHMFTVEHIHIMQNKSELFHTVLTHYKNEEVYIIDDALPILFEVKQHFPTVKVVWMERGEWATKQAKIPGFTPDATVKNLSDSISIVREEN